MKFYDSITIISFITIITMLIMISMNHTLTRRNKTTLISIYFMICLATLCEWCGSFLDGTKGNAIILQQIVVVIKLSITPIFPVVYANMVLDDLKNIEYKKIFKKIIYAVLVFHILIEIIFARYGIIFYVDKYGYRQYGNMYCIYMIICVVSIVYFIKALFVFNKYFQNKNSIVLFCIITLGITGSILQLTNSEHKIKWLCLINASALVYMYYNETIMYVDNLTELLNQAAWNNELENIKNTVIILLFDVDNFKVINDSYGHNFGDVILRTIGKCIKDTYGEYGAACYRKGGDEFGAILQSSKDYKLLNSIFVSKLEEARKIESRIPYVSIGYAQFDPNNQNVLDAIDEADKNLYYWKEELKKRRNSECECVNKTVP